jgi:methylglutaconyl-CoA hydratase
MVVAAPAEEGCPMDAPYETIRVVKNETVAQVVLHRPDIRNAFNEVMIKELRTAFRELSQPSALRAVVLSGEGASFCAGADLQWMRQMMGYSYEENMADALELAQFFRELYDFPLPLVGRINGAAIGGGTGLVAVCDFVVAIDSAVFSFSEVKMGLVPACISPYVIKRVGSRYARRYFLTGERLPAEQALRCGLVDRVVPIGDLEQAVEAYLQHLRSSGPQAVRTCKQMIRAVEEMSLEEAGPYTAEIIAQLRISDEGQEGMSAFLQHRQPRWGSVCSSES